MKSADLVVPTTETPIDSGADEPNSLQRHRSLKKPSLNKVPTAVPRAPLQTAAAGSLVSPSGVVTRILFVEDDKIYFGLLKRIIESVEEADFEIIWANDLRAGLEILRTQKIDIIVLDLMLPDSEGLATFERISEKADGTPIIVLSGVSDEKQAMEAVYLGAQDFLIKGQVGIQSLVRCIRYTLARLEVTEYRQRLQAIADFTAALAHDLRGPIIGADRVLNSMLSRTDGKLPDEDIAMLKILQGNNNFLRNKVDELLAIYRVEMETEKFNLIRLDLRRLVDDCVQAVSSRPTDAIHEIKITCDIPGGIEVSGNQQALTQLFDNLLSNAIKFSPSASVIQIAISRSERHIQLKISDQGTGIAAEDVHSLFKKFWRGGNHTFVPGTGLGLYFSEKIVRAHGGSISCESKLGEGSTFIVTLPAFETQ